MYRKGARHSLPRKERCQVKGWSSTLDRLNARKSHTFQEDPQASLYPSWHVGLGPVCCCGLGSGCGSRVNTMLAFLQIWEGLTLRFHRVIALDFLGFGFSDKPVSSRWGGPVTGVGVNAGSGCHCSPCCVASPLLRDHTSIPYLSRQAS